MIWFNYMALGSPFARSTASLAALTDAVADCRYITAARRSRRSAGRDSWPNTRGSVRGGEPRVGESRNAGVSSRASSRATASRVERAVLENWRRRC